MTSQREHQMRLWAIILSCGAEEHFERDLVGRIKYRRTSHYVRAELSPEFAELVSTAAATLHAAKLGAAGAAAAAKHTLRQRVIAAAERVSRKKAAA